MSGISYHQAYLFVSQYDELCAISSYQSAQTALRASAILRQLLTEQAAFLHELAGKIGIKLRFSVHDVDAFTELSNSPVPMDFGFISPHVGGNKTEVSLDKFLSMKIGLVHGRPQSALELIKFLANKEGGVHYERAEDQSDLARQRAIMTAGSFNGVPFGYMGIFEFVKVVVEGLEPLYKALRA